jgi:quercetin dioxygenase-like cupin family protein
MLPFKIDFAGMEWESPTSGARFKSYVADGKQLRLLELSEEFVEQDWCEKGHIGLVLEGALEVDCHGQSVNYKEGDGLFIPRGQAHKARSLTPVVRLILVEEI